MKPRLSRKTRRGRRKPPPDAVAAPPPAAAEVSRDLATPAAARGRGPGSRWRSAGRAVRGAVRGLRPSPAALLIGLAAGWQWAGMERILAAVLGPLPDVTGMFVVIALLAAAVGPWIPERLVNLAAKLHARWIRTAGADGDSDAADWMLRSLRARDESLMWLLISLLACAGGFVSLLVLALVGVFAGAHEYLLEHFFWTRLTLVALHWSATALLTGPGWMILGLLLVLLAPLESGRGDARSRAGAVVAGLLLGLGLACAGQGLMRAAALSGDQVLLLGLLPAFALAALAAFRSQRLDAQPAARRFASPSPPELQARGEGWIWLAAVVWGVGTTAATVGRLAAEPGDSTGFAPVESAGWSLAVAGLAALIAGRQFRESRRSASGCGMAVWAAGAGAGAGAILTAFRPDSTLAAMLVHGACGLPAGYALAYITHAWLARTGGRAPGFAQLLSAALGGSAIGLIAGNWVLLASLGPVGTMSAAALALLAFGGLVQIHETSRPARTRHLRLSLVFGALAVALVLFPAGARRWARSIAEGSGSAASTVLPDPLRSRIQSTTQVCVIAPTPAAAGALARSLPARTDVFSARRDDAPIRAGREARSDMRWFMDLRISPRCYDAIFYLPPPLSRTRAAADYSLEALALLADRLKPGGNVTMVVPRQSLRPRQLAVLAATFQRVFGERSRLALAREPWPDAGLLLVSRALDDPAPAASDNAVDYMRLDLVSPGAGRGEQPVHSVRRDRLSACGEDGPCSRIGAGPDLSVPSGLQPAAPR